MKWEYLDRMVIFQDAEGGMVSGLEGWINDLGARGGSSPPPFPSSRPTRTASPTERSACISSSSAHDPDTRGLSAPWLG